MSEVVWFVVITGLASLAVLVTGIWEVRKDQKILAAQRKQHKKAA